jgi:hypothetical protein
MVDWDDLDVADYDLAVADVGGGLRELTIPASLPDGSYRAVFRVLAGVAPATTDVILNYQSNHDFDWRNGTVISAGGDAEWYYATQTDVEDAISAAGLAIASNMENADTSPVVARIQRAGDYADALMNGRLSAFGYAVSSGGIDISASGDAEILKQISVGIVIAQLCRWRILQVPDFAGNPQATISKIADNHWKDADAMLDRIMTGNIALSAERISAGAEDNSMALDISGRPVYPGAYGLLP